jgi:hypothetical protein
VADGILNSYAKLDAIDIQIIKNSDNRATLVAKTKWITPLEIINEYYETIKRKGNGIFYLKATFRHTTRSILFDNNFISNKEEENNATNLPQDVLKQPELEILSAKLIQYKMNLSLLRLQNIDNFPADVVLKSTLYNHHIKY